MLLLKTKQPSPNWQKNQLNLNYQYIDQIILSEFRSNTLY